MSDRGLRDTGGTGGAAETKGGHRTAEAGEVRQQEIIHSIRQRQQGSGIRRFINAIKSLFLS